MYIQWMPCHELDPPYVYRMNVDVVVHVGRAYPSLWHTSERDGCQLFELISWAPIPFLVSYIRAVRFGKKKYADKSIRVLETTYAPIPIVNRALTQNK